MLFYRKKSKLGTKKFDAQFRLKLYPKHRISLTSTSAASRQYIDTQISQSQSQKKKNKLKKNYKKNPPSANAKTKNKKKIKSKPRLKIHANIHAYA